MKVACALSRFQNENLKLKHIRTISLCLSLSLSLSLTSTNLHTHTHTHTYKHTRSLFIQKFNTFNFFLHSPYFFFFHLCSLFFHLLSFSDILPEILVLLLGPSVKIARRCLVVHHAQVGQMRTGSSQIFDENTQIGNSVVIQPQGSKLWRKEKERKKGRLEISTNSRFNILISGKLSHAFHACSPSGDHINITFQ